MTDHTAEGTEEGAFDAPETAEERETAAFLAASLAAIPPLAEDRTALMLGLVRDAQRSLDSSRLKSARIGAHIGVEGLASLLRARGWKTSPLDIIQWEAGASSAVPPAVIVAIADELHIEVDRLTRVNTTAIVSRLESLRENPVLRSLVLRVAHAKSLSTEAAFSFLEQSQPSFAYRGEADDDQFLHILAQFVAHLESEAGGVSDG